MTTDPQFIRNFSIIAHIDHGKSTLADRLLETTKTISKREMQEQVLDTMDIERERGITIKAQPARMEYTSLAARSMCSISSTLPGTSISVTKYQEVWQPCEGALLMIDATQGVEARAANVHLALENNLEIVPIINKIDLPSAEPDRIKEEIEEVIGLPANNAVLASAKNNIGIIEVLESIIKYIPPPANTNDEPLRALVFDSYYESYRGIIVYFRVKDGEIHLGDKITFHG